MPREFKIITYPPMLERVYKAMGMDHVTHHTPTKYNRIGQSGIHTFIDDIINIVLDSDNESEAYKRLYEYIAGYGHMGWPRERE